MTEPDNLVFGHGIHAFPDRFFAVNETKLLLAELILNYAWRYKPGQNLSADIFIDAIVAPDLMIEVKSRRRQKI